jgi:uncharacterized protein (TIGR01440 family)
MEKILYEQARSTIAEISEKASLKEGSILVIGCSTSEIVGSKIGTNSAPEIAALVFKAFYEYATEKGIYLAVQCCEHLNRALVVEAKAMERYGFEEVTVRPMPKAGGAMGTAAYENFDEPVVVEKITAHMGLDIGQTLIGMHLKRVAVPVRLQHKFIGEAVLTAARVRPPLIGGERAKYPEAK